MAADAQSLQDLSLRRNELAALDASLKVTEEELGAVQLDLLAAYRAHREVLLQAEGGLGEDPPTEVAALETVVARLNGVTAGLQVAHNRHSAGMTIIWKC